MKFFNPNGKQEEFIKKVGNGECFVGIFSAANGVGKTALMANILGHVIWGHDFTKNPYFYHKVFRNFPYPKRARIASTKKNIEEIGAIQTEIKLWWPKDKYKTRKMGKTFDAEYIIEDGGWIVDIMSYDQDIQQYESATLGLMIFDEPPPLSIFYACVARMRKGGMILIFMTPLDEGGQLLEELEERENCDVPDDHGNALGKVEIVYADIEANCRDHGIRGQLEHNHIQQMTEFYSPEEREARQKGRPSHLVGKIYPSFDKLDPYVVEDFDVFAKYPGGVIVNIIDPHDAIPFAISWAYIDKTGDIWIYDEYPLDDLDKIKTANLTYPDYARIIREREGRYIADYRIIDPYFGNKTYGDAQNRDGISPKEELANFGLVYDDGDTSGIENGHKRVREFLKYDKLRPVDSLNHPKLHILSKCRNHWRSMLHYKKRIKKDGEVKDRLFLEETFKHFPDNIRHLCQKYDEVKIRNKKISIPSTANMISGGAGGW